MSLLPDSTANAAAAPALLDVAAIATVPDLAAALKLLWIRAGQPSHRLLQEQTRHHKLPLSRSTISRALRGERLPGKSFTLALVHELGATGAELAQWEVAWEAVALAESRAPAPRPSEVAELRESITQLQQALATQAAELAALREELNRRPSVSSPTPRQSAVVGQPLPSMVAVRLQQQMEGHVAQVVRERVRELADQIVANDPLLTARMLREMEGHVAMTGAEAVKQLADRIVAKDPTIFGRLMRTMEAQVELTGRGAVQDLARRIT
ncbi:hypothetical protein [Streptosporangium sp. NPDC051022]|uniref:hypothetical protein n=1 Tax=Streptosporangium sp. NPDC051022 TaxID=3155752 RepID=UPI00342079CC